MAESGKQRPKVTLAEIADAAQVSKTTVSIVLNGRPSNVRIGEETRTRVKRMARELGYRPNAAAKALVTGRSDTFLVLPFDMRDDALGERLRGVEAVLSPRGFTIRLCALDAEQGLSTYSQILRTGQADAVMLTGPHGLKTDELLREVREEAESLGVPIIGLVDAFPPGSLETIIRIDDESGAEEAVSHLIGHGRRRILHLAEPELAWGQNRRRGYETALRKAGIPFDPMLVVSCERSQRWVHDKVLDLPTSREFDAIFAATDGFAMAALSALKKVGRRVPADCALIGVDNKIPLVEYTDPPLTTLHNPFYETGRAGAEMLLKMIQGRPAEPALIPVSLVIRQSCGCP